MGFLGIGTGEILLVLILAVIILGPNKLPGYARKMGQLVRAVRKASTDLTTAVTRELDVQEHKQASSQKKEAGNAKAKPEETPPAVNQTTTPGQDDKPTTPGETSAAK